MRANRGRGAPACCNLQPAVSYQAVKRLLELQPKNTAPAATTLNQADPAIRPIDDYQRFWDEYSRHTQEHSHAHVDERT
jgi:hypothetical protein